MTLIAGDPVIAGDQNRAHGRITTTIAAEAAIRTARMSPRATLPSAWKNQLASRTTHLPASCHNGVRRVEMAVVAALGDLAGLAGSRHLTIPSAR